eukprot:gene32288-39048_t
MLAFHESLWPQNGSVSWGDSWESDIIIKSHHRDRYPTPLPASFSAAPTRFSTLRSSNLRSPTFLPSPWTSATSSPSVPYISPSAFPSAGVTSLSPTRTTVPSYIPSVVPTTLPLTCRPSTSDPSNAPPTHAPTATSTSATPTFLPSLIPTEFITWQPSQLSTFAPSASFSSASPAVELPFRKTLSFYCSNFTEMPPDVCSLSALIDSTIRTYYSGDELQVTRVWSEVNAVQPPISERRLRIVEPSAAGTDQFIVNSTVFYKALFVDSDYQLISSLETQQMQQSLRSEARRQQLVEYENLIVCSTDTIEGCVYNGTMSSDGNREAWIFCDKSAQGWQDLYSYPSSCPFSLLWYFFLLIVYLWLLLRYLYEMCFAAKANVCLHASSTLASVNCCVLRGLYFAYILSAVLSDDAFNQVACTELNFLEEDFDPTYALLQALFYLALLCAVTLHVEARSVRTGQPKSCIPSMIFASILGLCFWLLFVICKLFFEEKEVFPGFATLRVSSQCFVGLAIILLGGTVWWRFSLSACDVLQGIVLICTGIDTAATAFEILYTMPALSFWMYTVGARALEILSLWYLLQYDSQDWSLAAQEHRDNLNLHFPSTTPPRTNHSVHATYGDVKEIMHRVRMRLEGYRSYASEESGGLVTDRVFPSAPQPTWIEQWRDRASVPMASASVMLSRLSMRLEQPSEPEQMHLNTETEESRERQSRKRPRVA